MIHFVPFEAEHMRKIKLQPSQAAQQASINEAAMKTLEGDWSFTAFEGEKVVFCGGCIPMWNNRALMWCFMSLMRVSSLKQLVFEADRMQKNVPYQRLELTVEVDNKQAHQFARMIGFKLEAPCMKKYGLNGVDEALYARIK
jgi:hypothetical protein